MTVAVVATLSGEFPPVGLPSGGGPPHSKTLARHPSVPEPRAAFWSALAR
jgi:hypothetical protein